MGWYCVTVVFGLIMCLSLFPCLHYWPFLIIIIINITTCVQAGASFSANNNKYLLVLHSVQITTSVPVGVTFSANKNKCLVICSPARIAVCNTWSSGGTALCRVWDATSQLDLLSLTPLSVAGCGWLQLGAPHWATSVILLQVVDNWTHILW